MMRRERGMTLVEIALVLVVGSILLMASYRQYLSFRFDADVNQLKYNVNTLMSAMSSYYQANCGGSYGTLSPYNKTSPPNFTLPAFTIDIQKDLIANHYLDQNALLHVPLVLGYPKTDVPASYQVRFNLIKVPRYRTIYINNAAYNWPNNAGQVLMWVPEVMVLIKDISNIVFLKGVTGAFSCVDAAWTPLPACNKASALSFKHQVSFTQSKESGSSYWIINSTFPAFRQMQENYQPSAVISGSLQNQDFYVCGS